MGRTGAIDGGHVRLGPFPQVGQRLVQRAAERRLTPPTLALAGGVVGEALHGQLSPVADDLVGQDVPDCGHIVPPEQPAVLVERLQAFLG